MIAKDLVLSIHDEVIRLHGGLNGVRDIAGLESAIARPFQTFELVDLYPTCFEKAAAIGESFIVNHPFIDGNKRTGLVLIEVMLRTSGYKIVSQDDELYNFIIGISTGVMKFVNIVDWLNKNTAIL